MQDNNFKLRKEYIVKLGNLIKSHREQLNKSIYTISAETGIPRSTWRDVEFGESNDINLSNFCKISEGLDIYPWDLLKELYKKLGNNFSFTDLD